jgi:hypothetical protein
MPGWPSRLLQIDWLDFRLFGSLVDLAVNPSRKPAATGVVMCVWVLHNPTTRIILSNLDSLAGRKFDLI